MPFPSMRSSKSSNVKKTPMNYNIPNPQQDLHCNINNVACDHATRNPNAKTSNGMLEEPQVDNVKEPVKKTASTFSSFCITENGPFKRFSLSICTHEDFDVGEPSRFKHLRIDFTPIKGVDDNLELQQKCIDFWDFVKSEPMLNKIMAEPVKIKKPYDEMNEILYKVENINNRNSNVLKAKTAVQWTKDLPLNYLGKLSYKYCSDSPASYKHGSQFSESSGSVTNLSKSSTWSIKRKKETTPKDMTKSTLRAKENTKKICADMDEFDRKCPRSFEPPVRPPTLIEAKMQRLPPSISTPRSCEPLSTN